MAKKIVLQVLIVLQMLQPRLLYVKAASYDYQDVVMVLPEERVEVSMWTLAKPFDSGMWCATAGVTIYMVLVMWLLEQKIDPQRSALEVFKVSQNFKIHSWLARTVTAIWLLLMYIIASSYNTNLHSMLNAQKVNANELVANDTAIGYLKSYLDGYVAVDQRNLKAYTTAEECAQALSKGPNRGGVGVILMDPLDALHFASQRRGYTFYNIPPKVDTPRRLGVKDFLGWFIIAGMTSTLALIKFFFALMGHKTN